MSKLSDIVKGRKARKVVPFPGVIAPAEGQQAEIVLDLVVLAGDEEAEVLERARAYAKSKGVDAPKAGEPEYDLGLMVHTLFRACLDHDSTPEAPTPFFASADEILKYLDRERIVFLYTLQQVWQDEISPSGSKHLTEDRIWEFVVAAAEEEDPTRFFEKLPPASLGRLLHFTARRLLSALRSKSGSFSSSGLTGASTPSGSEPS